MDNMFILMAAGWIVYMLADETYKKTIGLCVCFYAIIMTFWS